MFRYYKYLFLILIVTNLFSSETYKKRYDILKYNLKLNIDMNNGSLNGSNSIYFVADTSIDNFVLHSSGLKILKVISGDTAVKFEILPDEKKLVIRNNFTPNDTNCVKVIYEYDSTKERAMDKKGIYFFKKEGEVLENIFYTMSEPSDARSWYPCWDEPNDKVLTDLEVRVNDGYTVASNGLLIKTYKDSDSTIVFNWKTSYPITTYLVSLAISKYSQFSHFYRRITNPADSIAITYYIWQPDSAGAFFNAVRAFDNVADMIKTFSYKYGEYPFEKYGMVAVNPFNFGGEEHQSLTTIHRYWLLGEEFGIVHELAHQWWGDMVTCATWKDIWLNESFATYSEYIWLESKTDDKKELIKKIESYERYGSDWGKAIYNPEGQGIKLFSDIVYQKGALVLHTLRSIIGDDKFFELLLEYRKQYEYSYADTEGFIKLVNKITGDDYQWFFEQYIYGKGYPKITYDWSYDESERTLNVTLEQIQSNDWPIYRLPLDLSIVSKYENIQKVEMDGLKRKQSYQISNIERPVSIEIDPEKKIFVKIIKNK